MSSQQELILKRGDFGKSRGEKKLEERRVRRERNSLPRDNCHYFLQRHQQLHHYPEELMAADQWRVSSTTRDEDDNITTFRTTRRRTLKHAASGWARLEGAVRLGNDQASVANS